MAELLQTTDNEQKPELQQRELLPNEEVGELESTSESINTKYINASGSRKLAQDNFWDDVTGPSSGNLVEDIKRQEKLKEEERQAIIDRAMELMSDPNALTGQQIVEKQLEDTPAPSKEQIKAGAKKVGEAVDKAPTSVKIAANVAGLVPEMVEDISNFGVDVVNGVSSLFGGPEIFENSSVIEDMLPSDTASQVTREIGKFLVGYGAILRGMKLTQVGGSLAKNKVGLKMVEAAAGFGADMIMLGPEQKALTHQLLEKLPISDTITDYLSDPEDSNLEKRFKNALFGIVDGQMAELAFKAIGHFAKVTKFSEFLADPSTSRIARERMGGEIDMSPGGRLLKFATRDKKPTDPLIDHIQKIQKGESQPVNDVSNFVEILDKLDIEGEVDLKGLSVADRAEAFIDVIKMAKELLKDTPVLTPDALEELTNMVEFGLFRLDNEISPDGFLPESTMEALSKLSVEESLEAVDKIFNFSSKRDKEKFKEAIDVASDFINNLFSVQRRDTKSPSKLFELGVDAFRTKNKIPKFKVVGKDQVEDIPKIADKSEVAAGAKNSDFIAKAGDEPDAGKVIQIEQAKSKRKNGYNTIEMKDSQGRPVYLNLAQLGKGIREFIGDIVKADPDSFGRDIVTEEELMEMSEFFLSDPNTIKEWTRANGLKQGLVLAATRFANAAGEAAHNALLLYNRGEMNKETVSLFLARAKEATIQMKDTRSMAGLLLREAAIPAVAEKEAARRAKKLRHLSEIFGNDLDRIAKETAKGGYTYKAFQKAMNNYVMPMADRLTQMRYASMLSNPATHARNIYSGAQTTLVRPFETLLAATYNAMEAPFRKFSRDIHGVYFSDAWHEAMGMVKGTLEAFIITARRMGADVSKIFPEGTLAPDFLGVDPRRGKMPMLNVATQAQPESVTGRAIQFLDNQVVQGEFVSDLLRFEDNFIKHINARMTLQREAHRNGRLARAVDGKSAEEAAEIIAKELNSPSERTMRRMYDEAEYNTFTNDIMAPDWVKEGLDNPIVKLVAPFARVNINSMSYTFERIPGVNLVLSKSRNELMSVDPALRQRALAKLSFASTVLTTLGMWLHGEDRITGSYPLDSKRRALFEQTGRLESSIRFGNEWIEIRGETPFGKILTTVANIASLRDAVDGEDDKFVQDAGLAAVMLFSELMNPDFLTENVALLSEALFADSPQQAKKFAVFGGEIVSQFIPYSGGARQFARQGDSIGVRKGGRIKRETFDPGSIIDTFWNRILNTYTPELLEPKRNILGRIMTHKEGLGPDIISPLGIGAQTENPVIQELALVSGATDVVLPDKRIQLGADEFIAQGDFINIQMPPRVITTTVAGKSITRKLRPAEYGRFVQAAAGINPDTGEPISDRTLEQALSDTIKSDRYKGLPLDRRGMVLRSIIEIYRNTGKAFLFKELGFPEAMRNMGKGVREALDEAAQDQKDQEILEQAKKQGDQDIDISSPLD